MEPELACVAALHSPETGIVDSHAYMNALRGDLEDRGGMIAFNTRIERITQVQGGWLLQAGGNSILVDAVVNAAGLGAQRWPASPRAIRRSACRGWFSARATTSATPAGRCSRG